MLLLTKSKQETHTETDLEEEAKILQHCTAKKIFLKGKSKEGREGRMDGQTSIQLLKV